MITPQQYQNLGGDILSDVAFPTYYKPIVTKNDYTKLYATICCWIISKIKNR